MKNQIGWLCFSLVFGTWPTLATETPSSFQITNQVIPLAQEAVSPELVGSARGLVTVNLNGLRHRGWLTLVKRTPNPDRPIESGPAKTLWTVTLQLDNGNFLMLNGSSEHSDLQMDPDFWVADLSIIKRTSLFANLAGTLRFSLNVQQSVPEKGFIVSCTNRPAHPPPNLLCSQLVPLSI